MAKRVTFLIPSAQSETESLPIIPERIELYWEVLSDSEVQRIKKQASTPSPNERGSFGNKSSPNKTPSPAKSRACRDTLTGRLRKRVGKPGSRRNRRWNNELDLGRRDGELSDTGPLEDEFEEYLFEESVRDNVFYQMFENPDLLQSFLPFMDITEEDERALLGYLTESDSGEEVGTFITPSLIAYQRISTAGKKTIEKYSESDFLAELDQVIFDFIQAESLKEVVCTNEFFTILSPSFTDPRLGLVMKDSFHRFLVHNICCYYNAHSCSVPDSSGSKTIYISKPTNLKHTPHQGLVDYIKTTHVDESYWTAPAVEKSKSKSKSKSTPSKKQSRNRKRAAPVVFTEAGWFN